MQPADVCQHETGRRETTSRKRTSLFNAVVGANFGADRFEVYVVLCGFCVPSGKDICEVLVVLLDAEQHGSTREILEGSLEVKRNKDSAGISLRKILNCLDHDVSTLRASHSVLWRSSTFRH